MKRHAFILSIVAAFISITHAADPAFTYVAEMTGMVCAGCKEHVTASFTKLKGVSNVKIIPGKKPGTQKVTISSSSSALTKEQAMASLGASAATYVVHSWEKTE